MSEKRPNPKYTGMTKYLDKEAGYAIWLPSDWHKFEMKEGHRGVIFSPYKEHFDTSFTAEKFNLKYKVTAEDRQILRDAFEEGLNKLEGVQIEMIRDEAEKDVVLLEAKLTFLENGQRRKRWVKTMYWGFGQLVLIAQGATVEDYEYWLPMLFNTMMTYEIT